MDFKELYDANQNAFLEYSRNFYSRSNYAFSMTSYFRKFVKEYCNDKNSPIQLLYLLVYAVLEKNQQRYLDVYTLLSDNNESLPKLDEFLLLVKPPSQSSQSLLDFEIIIGENINMKRTYDENFSYYHVYNEFSEHTKLSSNYSKNQIISYIAECDKKILCIIGHGNEKSGLKVTTRNGEYRFDDQELLNTLCQNKTYVLLSCAYDIFKDNENLKLVESLIIDNDKIGPGEQEYFLFFFLNAIKMGFNERQSFLLAELGSSSKIPQYEGTELYFKGILELMHKEMF